MEAARTYFVSNISAMYMESKAFLTKGLCLTCKNNTAHDQYQLVFQNFLNALHNEY